MPKYLDAAVEKKIPGAFEAIASMSDDRLDQWPGFVFQAMHALDPIRSVEWATRLAEKTVNASVISHACDFLDMHAGVNELNEVIRARIVELFNVESNRAHPCLYGLLRRYRIHEAAEIILNDVRRSRVPNVQYADVPVLDMLETLASLDFSPGHEYLLDLLPRSTAPYRKWIIEYLGKHRPEIIGPVLERYRLDEEATVRELCNRLQQELV